MATEIFTAGYEGIGVVEFLTRLKKSGVQTVVDVRANPISRKPGFSKNALATHLKAAGVEYQHVPALGCPKKVRDRYKLDGDWAAYTRGFSAYLQGQAEALAGVARIAAHSKTCLICFEADFNFCHRTFVARGAAILGDLRVSHIANQKVISDPGLRSAA
jgi:uncharacterized protein (DUF488 family)